MSRLLELFAAEYSVQFFTLITEVKFISLVYCGEYRRCVN